MAGATGESLWTTAVSGGGGIGYRPFQVFKVGVLPSGGVAAVGLSADANQVPSMTAVRLDAESGAERWRQDLRGSDNYGVGRALAIGGDGSLLVGGQLRNRRSCYDATVMRLDPDAGTVVRQRCSMDGYRIAVRCRGCGGKILT
jgi:outer membrane protein assembly factor BamB